MMLAHLTGADHYSRVILPAEEVHVYFSSD